MDDQIQELGQAIDDIFDGDTVDRLFYEHLGECDECLDRWRVVTGWFTKRLPNFEYWLILNDAYGIKSDW